MASSTPSASSPQPASLAGSTALARFEYEAGQTTNDATKVLMVEWEDSSDTLHSDGQWHISWRDRHDVLPAGDSTSDSHRLYFLLPPGAAVPPAVTLSFVPSDSSRPTLEWQTNALPAIFPPELGATAREAGKKGVLHTLWAKKRLAVLQAEIDAEYKNNFEGIGLEMALQEKEWIETNFGVSAKRTQAAPAALSIPTAGEFALETAQAAAATPASPRSPGGGSGSGRLLEKLRGLRVGTNERDLSPPAHGIATPPQTADNFNNNPLSPQSGDIAVSSFAAIKGTSRGLPHPDSTAAAAAAAAQPQRKIMVAQAPPAELLAQQEQVNFGMASLGAVAAGNARTAAGTPGDEDGDDLFALPMSPRSPEMAKSPFSFDAKDTQRYRDLATPLET